MHSAPTLSERPTYRRHRPKRAVLYFIIAEHYPRCLQEIEESGGHLPQFVRQEFEDYLKCGLLEHGFLRIKCDGCRHEHLVAFSCMRRGFCPICGARRMVESAAHLVDHVFPEEPVRQFVLTFPFPLRFLLAAEPKALTEVLAVVQRGISTFLIKRAGFTAASGAKTGAVTLIQRFGSALNLSPHLHMLFLDGAYRMGDNKVRFHRARRATNDDPGSSPGQALTHLLDTLRSKLECLCRYITRPPIATKRLSVDDHGRVVYRYKHPFRDGSTHVVLEPLDFIARLAALVPRPRLNPGSSPGQVLTRFHGIFAPNFKHRHKIVPQRVRGRVDSDKPLGPMSWAQRLKRVFAIDVECCPQCGGKLRVIACIEDPLLIRKILGHVEARNRPASSSARAPPALEEETRRLD